MKFISLIILAIFMCSCETNPFKTDPTNANDNPYPETASDDRIREEEREPAKDPADALSMIVNGEYEFSEGIYQEIKIKAEVPSPWQVDMEVEGLPAGATFDKESLTIGWKPGYFDGNEIGNPSVTVQIYPITVWLRSTDPNSEVRTANVSLIVHDSPLSLDIDGSDSVTVKEGEELSYRFRIENDDYPQGPFSVNLVDFPGNVKVEAVANTTNEFRLTFIPDYQHVNIEGASRCGGDWSSKKCLTYNGKIRVINPANHMNEKDLELNVEDVRLDTKIVTPAATVQGLDTSFQVAAYDLNGETTPTIKLVSDEPDYGVFKTNIVKDEETNSSVLSVSWSDIPPSYNGQTFSFKFMACSYDSDKNYNNCTNGSNKVTIQVKDRKAPIITRTSWPAGEIKYLNWSERKQFSIQIKDGDNTNLDVSKVEIVPEYYKRYANYKNGILSVDFGDTGIHQFSIIATSEYNVSSAESFVVEVFEKTRSNILYFTDSTRTQEVKFYRDTMGTVEIMNPALQILNERNLSGRDTLIVGTNILIDKSMQPFIQRAMDKIDNVIVATPLINNMPQKFIDELQLDFHVPVIGRYADLPNTAPISDMQFIARADFKQPKDIVSLKLTSSSESVSPMIFSLGVDRIDCVDVFDLTDNEKLSRYKIGIVCDRGNGGRYALFGTEFSDIKVSEQDKALPAKWLNKMLNMKLGN